jgi:hypothetical protein
LGGSLHFGGHLFGLQLIELQRGVDQPARQREGQSIGHVPRRDSLYRYTDHLQTL